MNHVFICTDARTEAVPFTVNKEYQSTYDSCSGLWEVKGDGKDAMPFYIEKYHDKYAILGGGYLGKSIQHYAFFEIIDHDLPIL